jgi:transposase InsO family protein/ribosomal protein L28
VLIEHWVAATRICEITGKHKTTILRRAEKERWTKRAFSSNGGKQYRYRLADLPEDVQIAYAASLQTTLDALREGLTPAEKSEKKADVPRYKNRAKKKDKKLIPIEMLPEERRAVARLREKVLFAWSASGLTAEAFIKAYDAGVMIPEIRAQLGRHGDIKTFQTLYRWLDLYTQFGLEGLAPQYAVKKGGNGASLEQRVKELIWFYYLNKNKWPVAKVIRKLKDKEGVEVSRYIVYRYIQTEIPESVKAYFRMGKKYFHDKFECYVNIDYTRYHSMQMVVYDHKTLDFASRVLRVDGWHMARLFVTVVIDKRSRKPLGWWVDETPSTLTIIRATRMMVETYGCPEEAQMDNGQDFRSYWFTGNAWNEQHVKFGAKEEKAVSSIIDDLGTAVHFTTPDRGQSKNIERFFGFMSSEFDKEFESYLGSNTATRPDEAKLYLGSFEGATKRDIMELPTVEETRELVTRFMYWFGAHHHHTGDGMNGRTPDEVFAENLQARRDIPEAYRKYIWTRREIKTVQRDGVKSGNDWYYNTQMQMFIGQQVELRVSIDDIGQAYIFSLDGEYLFDAVSEFKDKGITEENNRELARKRAQAAKHLDKYKLAIKELQKDRKRQLEELRNAKAEGYVTHVVNGDTVTAPANDRKLVLVKSERSGRKLKGLFDSD